MHKHFLFNLYLFVKIETVIFVSRRINNFLYPKLYPVKENWKMPLTNNMSLAFNVENFLRNNKIFNIQPQETFDPNGQHTTSQQGKSEVIVGN